MKSRSNFTVSNNFRIGNQKVELGGTRNRLGILVHTYLVDLYWYTKYNGKKANEINELVPCC